jgi:hypothetical protein
MTAFMECVEMQERLRTPSPRTEQYGTLEELFQECLEVAAQRAELLLAGDCALCAHCGLMAVTSSSSRLITRGIGAWECQVRARTWVVQLVPLLR